jgi:hypothetical protein
LPSARAVAGARFGRLFFPDQAQDFVKRRLFNLLFLQRRGDNFHYRMVSDDRILPSHTFAVKQDIGC